MNLKKILNSFKYSGFVQIGKILSKNEILELSVLSKKTFEKIRDLSKNGIKHPDYISPDSGVEGLIRLPQHNKRIAELIDKTLCDKLVISILDNVLGHSYKVWQVNFRRSSSNDRGLYIHQDAPGETNLCILLSNNKKGSGATTFLKGSHLVKKTMNTLKIEIPPFLLQYLSSFFTPLTGNAGDVAFFFNRTWHGRLRNFESYDFDVILISFFPSGSIYSFEKCGLWAPKFINSSKALLLGKLINPLIGTERLADGRYKVLGQKNKTIEVPYALRISNDNYIKKNYRIQIKLSIKIIFFKIIYFIAKSLYSLFKKARLFFILFKINYK